MLPEPSLSKLAKAARHASISSLESFAICEAAIVALRCKRAPCNGRSRLSSSPRRPPQAGHRHGFHNAPRNCSRRAAWPGDGADAVARPLGGCAAGASPAWSAPRRPFTHTSPLLLDDGPFSVAPMMDYTDRFLRFLLRRISKRATLYTEMVTANTLVHADPNELERFLGRDDGETPVVLQLGGSDPEALRRAAAIAAPWGFDAINLNCGAERPRGGARLAAPLMRERAARRVLRGDRRRRGPGRPGERQVPDRRRGRRRGGAAPRRRRGVREPLRLRRRRRRGQRRPPLCRPRAQGGARRALARAEPQGAAAQAGARPPPRRRARRHPVLAQRRAADGRRLRSRAPRRRPRGRDGRPRRRRAAVALGDGRRRCTARRRTRRRAGARCSRSTPPSPTPRRRG